MLGLRRGKRSRWLVSELTEPQLRALKEIQYADGALLRNQPMEGQLLKLGVVRRDPFTGLCILTDRGREVLADA